VPIFDAAQPEARECRPGGALQGQGPEQAPCRYPTKFADALRTSCGDGAVDRSDNAVGIIGGNQCDSSSGIGETA